MCDNKNTNECGCLNELLKKILCLQKQDFDDNKGSTGCDKPYLGPVCNFVCYNTRPLMLFNCSTGKPWSFPYVIDNIEKESTVFRIEAIDDCCATFRILYLNNENKYVSTNQFFTINLACVGAVKCLEDTYVEIC